MTKTTEIQYRKTKTGEWVAYGPSHMISVGPVNVAKRDGTTKPEKVVKVGKPFRVGNTDYVYGYLAPAAPAARQRRRSVNNSCDACEDGMSFGMRGGSICSECGGTVS